MNIFHILGFLSGLILISLSGCGGEVEDLQTQGLPIIKDYIDYIEPILNPLGCEACHTQELGGFKFVPSQDLTTSNLNYLYIKRAIDRQTPSRSPLLDRLTNPELSHPVYFCESDCRYQTILTWISTVDINTVNYDEIECIEPMNEGILLDEMECP